MPKLSERDEEILLDGVDDGSSSEPTSSLASGKMVAMIFALCFLPIAGFLAGSQYALNVGLSERVQERVQPYVEQVEDLERHNERLKTHLQTSRENLSKYQPAGSVSSCPRDDNPTTHFTSADVRCGTVGLAGLDLYAYEVNNIESVATYIGQDSSEIDRTAAGSFEFQLNHMVGGYEMIFYPDEETQARLGLGARYSIIPFGEEVIELLPEGACDAVCLDDLTDVTSEQGSVTLVGEGRVNRIEQVMHNIGAGTLGNRIELSDLELSLVE